MIYKIAFIVFLVTISMFLLGLFSPVTAFIAGISGGIAAVALIIER